jgi:hypothetical protein
MQTAIDDYERWRDALFWVDKILNNAGGYTACLFMGVNAFLEDFCTDGAETGMSWEEKKGKMSAELLQNFNFGSTPGLWTVSKLSGLFDKITNLWEKLVYGCKVIGRFFTPAVSFRYDHPLSHICYIRWELAESSTDAIISI